MNKSCCDPITAGLIHRKALILKSFGFIYLFLRNGAIKKNSIAIRYIPYRENVTALLHGKAPSGWFSAYHRNDRATISIHRPIILERFFVTGIFPPVQAFAQYTIRLNSLQVSRCNLFVKLYNVSYSLLLIFSLFTGQRQWPL